MSQKTEVTGCYDCIDAAIWVKVNYLKNRNIFLKIVYNKRCRDKYAQQLLFKQLFGVSKNKEVMSQNQMIGYLKTPNLCLF